MTSKSHADQYGAVAVSIHWLTTILIATLLVSGTLASDAKNPATKAMLLRLHVPIGLLAFVLTLFRAIWWLFLDKKPLPVSMPAWQGTFAHAIHLLLYFLIIGMSITGIGLMVLSGAGQYIFIGPPESLPDFWDYPPRLPHEMASRILLVLLVVHAGAALHHHFIKHDGLLRRMWFTGQNKETQE